MLNMQMRGANWRYDIYTSSIFSVTMPVPAACHSVASAAPCLLQPGAFTSHAASMDTHRSTVKHYP